jgi:hypothetical protein
MCVYMHFTRRCVEMPVCVLVFRRAFCTTDHVLQRLLHVGEFVHCEFYLPNVINQQFPEGVSVSNFSCHAMNLYPSLVDEYYAHPMLYTAVSVQLDEEEYALLLNYLFTLAQRQTPYNYRDLMWQLVPTRVANAFATGSTVVDSKNVNSLYCAQAMLLALRHCLKKGQLIQALSGHIDRTVLPQQLFESVRGVSTCCSKVRLLSFSARLVF